MTTIKLLISGFFLFFPLSAWAQLDLASLSRNREWTKLLHYRTGLFGDVKSEVANHEFFLANDGRTNPESELRAHIEAFEKQAMLPNTNELAACAFPARFSFLQRQFPDKFKKPECGNLEKWRAEIDARSVTLIFSSYFQSAPASMFGHSFLRLNRGAGESFLDLAVDYSAMVGNDSALKQIPFGLFGFYHGQFTLWPYYIKVKEYNNAENRDIFEYDLDFSPAEMERLILHLWELGRAKMNYYFLDRNCSYEILALLNAAKPEWSLSEKFYTHAIPVDTVRAVADEIGEFNKVTFRPSLRRRLDVKWNKLSSESRRDYFAIAKLKKEPNGLRDPILAEALGLHFAIRQIESHGELPPQEARVFHSVNLQRSQLPKLNENDFHIEPLPRPDLAHKSARLGIAGGTSSSGSFAELNARVALHETLERDAGYVPASTLEVLKFRARSNFAGQKLAIEEATFANLVSLTPMTSLTRQPSFELEIGFRSPHDRECDNCIASHARFGYGGALGSGKFLGFLLATAQVNSGSMFDRGWRLGPGLRSGVVIRFSDRAKMVFDGRWNHYFNQTNPGVFEWRLSQGYSWSDRIETHLTAARLGSWNEILLTQHFYY